LQRVGDMDGKNDADPGHFIPAGCAWAKAAQHLSLVTGFVTVGPQDLKFVRSDLLDLCWSGCLNASAHSYSTSRIGASKLRMLTCCATFCAISRSTFELGASGIATTIGLPMSDCLRIATSNGTSPKNGIPSSAA